MKAECVFLGTGGSAGVPMIGCSCAVCTSSSPYNQRLRSSVWIQLAEKNFVIDTGPEFRLQALREKIHELDAVFLTHAHFDHIAGIDDLRSYFFLKKQELPCFLSKETFDEIKQRSHYLFETKREGKSLSAQLDFRILEGDFGSVEVLGLKVQYLTYYQGSMKVTGYRIGNFAYVSDIRTYTEELLTSLKGVKVLVLSALSKAPSPMHFTIEEAVEFSRKVGAAKTYLTHIAHDLDYERTNAFLPNEVRMSYDGLKIAFEY